MDSYSLTIIDMKNYGHLFLVLDYLCDFLYLADIFVRVHEGYLEQGLMVKDTKLLRKNYWKSSNKIWDILSIFPTDFAYFAFRAEFINRKRV